MPVISMQFLPCLIHTGMYKDGKSGRLRPGLAVDLCMSQVTAVLACLSLS